METSFKPHLTIKDKFSSEEEYFE